MVTLGLAMLAPGCKTAPPVKTTEDGEKYLVSGKLLRPNSKEAGFYPFEVRQVAERDRKAMESSRARLSDESAIVETGTSNEDGLFQVYLPPGEYCISFPRLTEVRCDQPVRLTNGPVQGLVFRAPF